MKHFLSGLGAVSLAVFMLLALVSAQPADVPGQDPSQVDIDPELESKFQQQGLRGFSIQQDEREEILVKLGRYRGNPDTIKEMKSQASESQSPILKMAENNPKIEVKQEFWITNAVLLEASTDFPLENIASVKGVKTMDVNSEIQAVDPGLETRSADSSGVEPQASDSTYGLNHINATEVWSQFDTKGEGARVAVLDTGVEPSHPDIDLYNDSETSDTEGWAEFNGGEIDSEPYDCGYHGTHVSGTVSGGDDSGENIGVAPGVELFHAGVLMQNDCSGADSDVISGIEWAVENDADVVSMSLGAQGITSDYIDPIRNARSNGTIVISASGNDGEGTSSSPGNVYDSLNIGASNETYGIVDFSSGDTLDKDSWNDPPSDWPEQYIVPDLAAPGDLVLSSIPGDTSAGACTVSDQYCYISGTSMATPHVSGAAALMESATVTDLTTENVTEAFVQTAWKPDSWDEASASNSIDDQDTRYGHGIIDAYSAIDYAIENFDQGVSVENETINTTEAEIEESFKVSGDIENLRDQSNQVKLELRFNQTSAENKTFNLNAGESKSFQYIQNISDEGLYEVYVNDTLVDELDVYMPEPEFSLTAQVNESEIVEGKKVNVSGDVNNTGGDGEADLRLFRNSTEIGQQTVSVTFESVESYSFVNQYDEPGIYDLSVNSTSAGEIDVLNDAELNISDFQLNNSDQFFENDTVEASVTAENLGDVSGTFNVSLDVDDVYDQSSEVDIPAGSSETVNFERSFPDRGNYTLSSGNLSEDLEVLEDGSIDLLSGSLSNSSIVENESVNYTVEFENTGDVQASDTIEFMVDSQVEETREVNLSEQSSSETVFNKSFDEPGEYTLAANSSLGKDLDVLDDAELNVTGLSLSSTSIVEGEDFIVNVSVRNVGDVSGEFSVPMNITGESNLNQTDDIELDPGSEKNVSFEQNLSEPGSYSAETTNYSESFDILKEANITITNSSVNSTEIFTGQDLGIDITVENTGDVSGQDELNYSLGSLEKLSGTGEVSSGSTENVSETLTPLSSGNYSAEINGSDISDVEVKRPNVSIGNSSFNVSEKGLVEVKTLLNNTDPGTVNESLELSINESDFSKSYFLEKNQEKNVTLSVDWNQTGFYILELNGSEIGNFSLDHYSEFSDLSPNGSTFSEDEEIEFSGDVYSVGEPNLTVYTGESELEANLSKGLDSFSFEESPSPGSYDWYAETSFGNSTFTSESLGYEVEEESSDSGGDGGSSGSTGGSGGFSGGFSQDPEVTIKESENRIEIYDIYEGQALEFNQTGLQITGLEFDSDAENGTVEFRSRDIDTDLSFSSTFEASSNISGPYTIEFEVGSDWLEENRFQASDVSLYRNGSDGWEDQEAEILEGLEDRTIYQAEVQDFSIFGIGVDRACYSTENVTAETDESCSTYRNPCEVPENAEEVESCTSFEEEQQVRREIEQKKQEVSDGEKIEKLAEAENLIEQGNITQARRMVQEVDAESEPGESRILIFLILSSAFAITGLAGYMVFRRRRKHQMVMEMAELVDMLKDLQSQGRNVRIPAMKLQQANEALQNDNYSKAERKTERVKEHLKREL